MPSLWKSQRACDERSATATPSRDWDFGERILAAFSQPFSVGHAEQHIGASVGIALSTTRDSSGALLDNADTAMYRAKEAGGNAFEFFDIGMRARVRREFKIRTALLEALRTDELSVRYQPIVSLRDGELLGVEALVRWLHPGWGWISPNEFVPLAEEDGTIIAVDQFVLAEAAGQMAQWRDQFPSALPLGLFVNTSPRQLSQSDFIRLFKETLDRYKLGFSDVGIEITERVFVDESDAQLIENLTELARMGIRLSLDDFGTGYSALASLQRFPLTALKIDRYFTGTIRAFDDRTPIVTAVVSLGRALGLTVIAEGVDEQAQADHLRALGCEAAQGFLFAPAQSAEDFTELLSAGRAGGVTSKDIPFRLDLVS